MRIAKYGLVLVICGLALGFAPISRCQENSWDRKRESPPTEAWFIEKFYYHDYLYSSSHLAELGERINLNVRAKYQFNDHTYGRFGLNTDPIENSRDNKTSDLELHFGHQWGQWEGQLDLDLKTNDGDKGGTSLGPDVDSADTFLTYRASDSLLWLLYPFNFGSSVGREFNTWDVARIYFIEGAPTAINNIPVGSEKVVSKTIPGIELRFFLGTVLETYVGLGLANFLYPADPDFDVENNRLVGRWERRMDLGYKWGVKYRRPKFWVNLQHVGHTNYEDTGALLASATSTYGGWLFSGPFILEGEWTISKAGKRPFRLQRDGNWFLSTSTFRPIYSDLNNNHQDWPGKFGHGLGLKLLMDLETSLVYISYKYQDQYFIYKERESAHNLRTGDEDFSHGGLSRYGLGIHLLVGKFDINPQIEWMQARNLVFSNHADMRPNKSLSSLQKHDYVLTVSLKYNFDGSFDHRYQYQY